MQYNKSLPHYEWLVETLREGYMNDTLEAGSPCGCGLGNLLVKKAMQLGHGRSSARDMITTWTHVFCTQSIVVALWHRLSGHKFERPRKSGAVAQYVYSSETHQHRQGMEVLKLLELPIKVLMDLEWEFEVNQVGDTKDEQMFNGLMACIAVLDEYFEIPAIKAVDIKLKFMEVQETRLVNQ